MPWPKCLCYDLHYTDTCKSSNGLTISNIVDQQANIAITNYVSWSAEKKTLNKIERDTAKQLHRTLLLHRETLLFAALQLRLRNLILLVNSSNNVIYPARRYTGNIWRLVTKTTRCNYGLNCLCTFRWVVTLINHQAEIEIRDVMLEDSLCLWRLTLMSKSANYYTTWPQIDYKSGQSGVLYCYRSRGVLNTHQNALAVSKPLP